MKRNIPSPDTSSGYQSADSDDCVDDKKDGNNSDITNAEGHSKEEIINNSEEALRALNLIEQETKVRRSPRELTHIMVMNYHAEILVTSKFLR